MVKKFKFSYTNKLINKEFMKRFYWQHDLYKDVIVMELIPSILGLFINHYIKDILFEKWLSENESLEEFLGRNVYMEAVGRKFNVRSEVEPKIFIV